MRRNQAPAHDQKTFIFPPPTIEERIAHVPKYQKPLARIVEGERQNLREALNHFFNHGSPKIQKEADQLLQCVESINPIELAYRVRNMHYPADRRIRRKGYFALGTIHRGLADYWRADSKHIGATLREVIKKIRALTKNSETKDAWLREHAGMRSLDD